MDIATNELCTVLWNFSLSRPHVHFRVSFNREKNFQTAVINLVEVPARPFNARATFNFPQHFQRLRANEILAAECVRFYVRSFN